ncbi:MAG: hypothetical protein RLZZ584_221 [Pseudomonadota bacterium]
MAMNMPSSGGSDEPIMDINTTPLIDVMLVLLVMLIITIPIQLHTVNLNMPVGAPPPSDVKPEVVKIDIDENSKVYWQGVVLTSRAEMEDTGQVQRLRRGDGERQQDRPGQARRDRLRAVHRTAVRTAT